jgi:hypothetical protein
MALDLNAMLAMALALERKMATITRYGELERRHVKA